MRRTKKIFLIFLLAVFLISLSGGFSFAQRELEVKYPGTEAPRTVKTYLPAYVKYIFNLSIIIAVLVSLGTLIYGGITYLASAGAPIAMKNAKDQIFASLLGLVLLLFSYLILITINPQLVILKATIAEVGKGVILYQEYNCTILVPEDYQKYNVSISDLRDISGNDFDQVRSIKFLSSGEDLIVEIYPEMNWEGQSQIYKNQQENDCESFSDLAASLLLKPQTPGVYLYPETGYGGDPRIYDKPRPQYADLGDFHDKAQSIKFKHREDIELMYGVVLHEDTNFGGKCTLSFLDKENLENTEVKNKEISSITIFGQWLGEPTLGTVTLYEDEEYGGRKKTISLGFYPNSVYPLLSSYPNFTVYEDNGTDMKFDGSDDNINDEITSIKIDGSLMVVLYEDNDYKGKCSVFFPPFDASFRDDAVGRCRYITSGWVKLQDCASSMKIFPIKIIQ